MIKKGIFAGIAVACGGFAFYNKDKVVKHVKTYCVERKLIRWSNDGSDFLGPVTPEQYNELSGKRYVSPDGSMVIGVYSDGISIKTEKGDAYTYKCLHPDGNTRTYVERQGTKLTCNRVWDENGYEIDFLDEKEDRSWPY